LAGYAISKVVSFRFSDRLIWWRSSRACALEVLYNNTVNTCSVIQHDIEFITVGRATKAGRYHNQQRHVAHLQLCTYTASEHWCKTTLCVTYVSSQEEIVSCTMRDRSI
jgi:hypothetical protein